MLNQCHIGDCRELLKQFAAAGVRAQMCVTSPPYFGLRDYGADGQIGLEPSPAEYVAEIVSVFAAVRDVLTDDGTVWLNLGDSYAGGGTIGRNDTGAEALARRAKKYGTGQGKGSAVGAHGTRPKVADLKAKDLIGIPWRVAFALQADGWYLRSDIIWHKPNPMPESVTDRPTKAHEYLFLLAKSERYYYDADAIAEPFSDKTQWTYPQPDKAAAAGQTTNGTGASGLRAKPDRENRNRRSVWSIATQPFDGAHFATFPRTLIEPCILAGSRPGDVVLDPFMGSGTTAQVSEHLGRQWIGCELNPEYVTLQAKRLQQRAMAF
jgi:DNA modification methylase